MHVFPFLMNLPLHPPSAGCVLTLVGGSVHFNVYLSNTHNPFPVALEGVHMLTLRAIERLQTDEYLLDDMSA